MSNAEMKGSEREVLTPHESILVSVGVNIPEPNLIEEIDRRIGGIKTVNLLDEIKYGDNKDEEFLRDLKDRLKDFTYGILVLHEEDYKG